MTLGSAESPLTPAYQHEGKESGKIVADEGVRSNALPVGRTSADPNSSYGISTPPLSPPPCQRSPSPFVPSPPQAPSLPSTPDPLPPPTEVPTTDDDCPTDYRGRALCPHSPRPSTSLRARSSELADASHEFGLWVLSSLQSLLRSILHLAVNLSPFVLASLIVHLLFFVELAALVLEDSIVRIELSNPLPASFERGTTWGKRMSRMKWRARGTGERYWRQVLGIVALATIVGVVGRECWRTGDREGWEDVPFGRYVLQEVEGEAAKPQWGTWGRMGPFREVIVLEVRSFALLDRAILIRTARTQTITAFFALLAPLKHLLPHSLLPPSIPAPTFLCPSPPLLSPSFFPSPPSSSSSRDPKHPRPTRISLSTPWLLTLLSDMLTSTLTLLQFISLTLLFPSYSPLSLPPHLFFHCLRGRVNHIKKCRTSIVRTVVCLETVTRVFPGDAEEEDEWACAICFEGKGEEEGPSEEGRCKLPCGHTCTFFSPCPSPVHRPRLPRNPADPPHAQITPAVSSIGSTINPGAPFAINPSRP